MSKRDQRGARYLARELQESEKPEPPADYSKTGRDSDGKIVKQAGNRVIDRFSIAQLESIGRLVGLSLDQMNQRYQ